MIFNRKPKEMPKPEDIIFKLEFSGTVINQFGDKVDMYLLYWDSRTEEMISIGIPHGREDIAQYVQERLNK
jgi:hypothetical protein